LINLITCRFFIVVRQAPFAIEEDGFGTFQLQIEVAFLDCVTTFYYDLTLFDQNALHTYRTIQMDPAPEDWSKLIQLGGVS
uniref:Neur_chan_LBD domain-containing protein n=1 Tax=Schistosoma curassoni TaxID=6186 RepID=A0A183L618_9TREM